MAVSIVASNNTIAISGIIGAIIGANISTRLEVNKLKRYFGIFLAIIAIYEIYSLIKEYKIQKNRDTKKEKKEEKTWNS